MRYISDDGKVFNTEQDCLGYENSEKSVLKMRKSEKSSLRLNAGNC